MSLPSPLRPTLSRRRRKLPLDGRVAGVEYPRFRGRFDQPIQTSRVGRHAPNAVYPDWPQPVTYDPSIGPYRFASSDYEPPDLWHDVAGVITPLPGTLPGPGMSAQFRSIQQNEGEHAGRLLLRVAGDASSCPPPQPIPIDRDVQFKDPVVGPALNEQFDDGRAVTEVWDSVLERPTYESSLMTPELFYQQMPSTDTESMELEAGTVHALEDTQETPGDTADSIEPQLTAIECDPGPEADVAEPEHVLDTTSLPDPGMDPMAASIGHTMSAPDQLQYGTPLEDIVAQEMQGIDPYTMPDPYHTIGPYGPMPDPRMMGMPMDPFGPMPPGLGPMGPMMGPGMGPM